MEHKTIEQIIDKTSEMYRETTKEAKRMSERYDKILRDLSDDNIPHKEYLSLQNNKQYLGAEINNTLHVAKGISDVREMLFTLMHGKQGD